MSLHDHHGGWVIALSFVLALALSIVPLPDNLEFFRPEWVALTLIYWCLALPARVGVGVGWFMGLLLDVSRDALLGQHALALALIAFLTLHLHQRMRVFPIWQQAAGIFVLIALECLITLWVKGLIGESASLWKLFATATTSMLAWPLVFLTLRHARRSYQVN